jgi:hypothetical protein
MLFESGRAAEVQVVNKTALPGRSPVDAYLVIDCAKEMTVAAQRGVAAAFAAVRKYRPQAPLVVGFDLKGLDGSYPAVGASGGLAFGLALAKEICFKDCPPIAATGEVLSAGEGGLLGGIRGIEAKIEAAAARFTGSGLIFYPVGNDGEISNGLRERIRERGLRLFAVASVAEAIEVLHLLLNADHGRQPAVKMTSPRRVAAGLAVLAALGLAGAGFTLYPSRLPPAPSGASPSRSAEVLPAVAPPAGTEPAPIMSPGAGQRPHPLAPDISLPEIEVRGSGKLATAVADHLAAALKEALSTGAGVSVRGQTEVLAVEEEEETNNKLRSSLTIRLQRLALRHGDRHLEPPPFQVTVSGQGQAADLAARTGELLAANLLQWMQVASFPVTAGGINDESSVPKEIQREGFE